MTEATQHRVTLGIIAGFLGVILAALFGFAPTPAQADTIEQGGLVFTFDNNSGPTKTTVSEPDEHGVITILGGNVNMTVTQQKTGTGTIANAIAIGDGKSVDNNYTGTITFDNVNLMPSYSTELAQNAQTNNISVLTFQNVEPSKGTTGATVVLTNGTTFTGSLSTAEGAKPVVAMDSATSDTLELQAGTTIQAFPGDEEIELPTGDGDTKATAAAAPVAAISVVGAANNDQTMQTILFTGAATVTGGNGDADAPAGAIAFAPAVANGTALTIQADANATVNGYSAAKNNAAALTVIPGENYALVENNKVQISPVTIQGSGELTMQGGDNTAVGPDGTPDNGAPAIYISGATAEASASILGTGTVVANGGDTPDYYKDNAVNGGAGVEINSGETADLTATLNVAGGTLEATGGNGGDGESGNNAGPGIGLTGNTVSNQDVQTPVNAVLNVTGGTVVATGGNGGNATGESDAKGGSAGFGILGSDSVEMLVSNGTGTNMTGPTITAIAGEAGTGGDGEATTANAIGGIGEKGAGITLTNGSADDEDVYPWVALTAAADPTKANATPATVVGFGGESDDVFENTTQVGLTTDEPVDADDAGPIIDLPAANWAQITPSPITDLQAGITNTATPAVNVQYVVAQTTFGANSMTGSLPNSSFVYTADLTANFDGLLYAAPVQGFINFLGDTDASANDYTIDDAANVTMKPNTDASKPDTFYVNPTAEGDFITVSLDPTTSVDELADMYPDLSVSPVKVPIVYTVMIDATNAANGGAPKATAEAVYYYTAPDGSGTLTSLGDTALAATLETDKFVKLTNGSQLVVTAAGDSQNFTPEGTNTFIGLYDEVADPMELVSNTAINGWTANAQLTAEFGTVKLNNITPSPTQMQQGATTTIFANYTITPKNTDLTYYNIGETGINLEWAGIFVREGQGNYGSAASNGVNISPTDSADVTGSGPWTVSAAATVDATTLANLGHYRFAPCGAAPWGIDTDGEPNGAGNLTSATSTYGIVEVVEGEGIVAVYRVFNPNTGEHLYTSSWNEANYLDTIGWNYETIAWTGPEKSNVPIYRLYNPNNGDHMYTTSMTEYNGLKQAGWRGEGALLYSAPNTDVPIYRLWCQGMTANGGAYSHLWTGDFNEYTVLGNGGWTREGTAWYAFDVPNPAN